MQEKYLGRVAPKRHRPEHGCEAHRRDEDIEATEPHEPLGAGENAAIQATHPAHRDAEAHDLQGQNDVVDR